MKVEIKDGKLIIEIAVNNPPVPSRGTGKSLMVASTGGNIKTGIMVGDKELTLGLNAYIPR
jgi:hypothetical protein